MELGILAVCGMFVVPAYLACQNMFGADMVATLKGQGPDRVKYTKQPGVPPAPGLTASEDSA
ncbi:MAG: hypothetical protein AAF677_00790 [Pseudomonadota bacterium]